jgi:hypothetical protein
VMDQELSGVEDLVVAEKVVAIVAKYGARAS